MVFLATNLTCGSSAMPTEVVVATSILRVVVVASPILIASGMATSSSPLITSLVVIGEIASTLIGPSEIC